VDEADGAVVRTFRSSPCGQAADEIVAAGALVAFTTPEAHQGLDLTGDLDSEDVVIQVYDAADNTIRQPRDVAGRMFPVVPLVFPRYPGDPPGQRSQSGSHRQRWNRRVLHHEANFCDPSDMSDPYEDDFACALETDTPDLVARNGLCTPARNATSTATTIAATMS